MQILAQQHQFAADLHWLAFLLTGDREMSVDLAVEAIAGHDGEDLYFHQWMQAWTRRVVIAKALATIHDELTESAGRMERTRTLTRTLPDYGLASDRAIGKIELERALLAIEPFPRAALVLSVFEGMSIEDTAVLLNADADLVRKAQAAGLAELTVQVARMHGWTPAPGPPCWFWVGRQHV
jgi:DNA-directed RNA polymerase specialized sigma24 family protein